VALRHQPFEYRPTHFTAFCVFINWHLKKTLKVVSNGLVVTPQFVEMSSQLRFLESFFIICWLLSLFIAVVNKLLMALNSL